MALEYLHLPAGSALPPLRDAPFRAVVVVEQEVTHEWREQVSKWLVAGGCLCMMAWGQDCSLWDDSVDYANLDEFDYGDIPEDRFVMTSWHKKQSLSDVYWFAEHCASHSTIELEAIVILDIVTVSREAEMFAHYEGQSGRVPYDQPGCVVQLRTAASDMRRRACSRFGRSQRWPCFGRRNDGRHLVGAARPSGHLCHTATLRVPQT